MVAKIILVILTGILSTNIQAGEADRNDRFQRNCNSCRGVCH